MTVSFRIMSAGTGYEYLLKSVVTGDGNRDLSSPLTRYYAEQGTPPGVWRGRGVAHLGEGRLATGQQVTEQHLQLLMGYGRDPVTGMPLGRAYPKYTNLGPRTAARASVPPSALPVEEPTVRTNRADEGTRATPARRAVAGYDITMSVPKSVSALWGLADAGTQALIAAAHHEAVGTAIDFFEREIAATRGGATRPATGNSPGGAVVQLPVDGVSAACFDHWDSRAGDPQLHTHAVLSAKVCAADDGRWLALDGRPVHYSMVALSEFYNAVLADNLARTLGLAWERRTRPREKNPAWELARVPEALIGEFSTRTKTIDTETDRLISQYTTTKGHRPSQRTILRLRQQATLATRPDKQLHSLADLTANWRQRAAVVLDDDATSWARQATSVREPVVLLRTDDIPVETIEELGRSVVAAVGDKRSTWRRWNLHAEATRQTMGWRFASATDREAVTALVADAAERASLRLTPTERASVPARFARADGTSMFRPTGSTVFTSEALFAAEERLLALSRRTDGPTMGLVGWETLFAAHRESHTALGADQAEAITQVVASGRVVDILVGPAGAGKTTTMRMLREVWEDQAGPGSVVGLAPSATAASVLGEELGIPAENTAKWLTDHHARRTGFAKGQLVIVDEASLAGTFTLDRICGHAADAGAKVLLVGDWAQLQAVEAGGTFALLAADRQDTPTLVDVHRFTHEWEKTASLDLRHGRVEAIDTYMSHGRVTAGADEEMRDAAYSAWRADMGQGRASILIAEDRRTVTELNARAREDRIAARQVDARRSVELADGTRASAGDVVITRRNDRRLQVGRSGWVRNGDRWTVTTTHDDGSVTVRRAGRRFGASVVLPAGYVAERLDLGYAVTVHRAQGLTVDTAHTVVTQATRREGLYVAMTRGRHANTAYVVTDTTRGGDMDALLPPGGEHVTAQRVLASALRTSGAELSAHATVTSEDQQWNGIAQLAAEYETIAATAQRDRWARAIRRAGFDDDVTEALLAGETFDELAANLKSLDAAGHVPEWLLPRAAAAGPLPEGPTLVRDLMTRLHRAKPAHRGLIRPARPAMIVGLVPEATGPLTREMRAALDQRKTLIQDRATAIVQTAIAGREAWLGELGPQPPDQPGAARWWTAAVTTAAYRDRHSLTGPTTLRARPTNTTMSADAARVRQAVTQIHGPRAVPSLPARRPAPQRDALRL